MEPIEESSQFKGTCRKYIGTLNNPQDYGVPLDSIESWLKMWVDKADAKYVNGQLEKGEKNGIIHIQFFLWFK